MNYLMTKPHKGPPTINKGQNMIPEQIHVGACPDDSCGRNWRGPRDDDTLRDVGDSVRYHHQGARGGRIEYCESCISLADLADKFDEDDDDFKILATLIHVMVTNALKSSQ